MGSRFMRGLAFLLLLSLVTLTACQASVTGTSTWPDAQPQQITPGIRT